MSQHDFSIDNGPGLAVRTDMNAAIQALATMSSGPVEPTTKYPGQIWLDTTVAPDGQLRMRNQANTAWVDPPFALAAAFAAADIGFGARTSPNRFVWNDQANLAGTDVATLSEVGELSVRSDLKVQQRTGNISRVVMTDAAGTTRMYVTNDQAANSCVIQPQNAAGAAVQTLVINAAGISLGLGAAAGTVLTTGNFISTATAITDTVFPVGHQILAFFGAQVLRNASFAATLDNGNNAQYTAGGAGAALAGTWRVRGGWFTGTATNYIYLVQRVS